MSWNIIFFKSPSGKEVVKDSIRSFENSTISKIGRLIDILRNSGPLLGMPYSKKMSSNLYELRIRGHQEIRIFYTFKTNCIYFLHIFQKKSQKTPTKEMKTAGDRLNNLTKS